MSRMRCHEFSSPATTKMHRVDIDNRIKQSMTPPYHTNYRMNKKNTPKALITDFWGAIHRTGKGFPF